MRLYYWNWRRNFGDELNLYILPRLAPELLNDDESSLFLGIGTILNREVPVEPHKIVFSSGLGYGPQPLLDDRWHIYCVRGPLTQRALGLPAGKSVSDAGLLIRDFFERRADPTNDIGFLAHWAHASERLAQLVGDEGLVPIDPMRSPEDVIDDIRGVQILITESLHGAIVADSLRIPWIPLKLSESILDFKWHDWCATVGIDYLPIKFTAALPQGRLGRLRELPFVVQLRRLRRQMQPVLSKEGVVSNLCDTLKERLQRIREDWS